MFLPAADALEIARRAERGPLMTNGEFTVSRLGRHVVELQRRHGLRYDPGTLIVDDSDFTAATWQAGCELLERCGLFLASNRRVLEFSGEEIADAIAAAPHELVLGTGEDTVTVGPEGGPVVFGGPFNALTDDRWFLCLNEAFAAERDIDVLHIPASLVSFQGQPLRPESALAVEAAVFYGRQAREAVRRAGRPGMPIVGHVFMAPGEHAASDPCWGLRRSDARAVALLQDLTLEDHQLGRIHYYRHYGSPVLLAFTPLIAAPGPSNDPAATAIIAVASTVASAVLGCAAAHFGPQHARFRQQANPHSIWCASVVARAVRRHSPLLLIVSHTTGAGPGTAQYAYEFTAALLATATAGVHVAGPRPAEPPHLNAVSPLMARLFARVARGVWRWPAAEAEPRARALLGRFAERMGVSVAPPGLPFEELYATDSRQPLPEHVAAYQELEAELTGLGIPLAPAAAARGGDRP